MSKGKKKKSVGSRKVELRSNDMVNELFVMSDHANERMNERFIHMVDILDTVNRGKVSIVLTNVGYGFRYRYKCYYVILTRRIQSVRRSVRYLPKVVTVMYNKDFIRVIEEQKLLFNVSDRHLTTSLTRVYDELGDSMYGEENRTVVTEKLESYGLPRSDFLVTDEIDMFDKTMVWYRENRDQVKKILSEVIVALEKYEGDATFTTMRVGTGKHKKPYSKTVIGKTTYVYPTSYLKYISGIDDTTYSNMLDDRSIFRMIDMGDCGVLRSELTDVLYVDVTNYRIIVRLFPSEKI